MEVSVFVGCLKLSELKSNSELKLLEACVDEALPCY